MLRMLIYLTEAGRTASQWDRLGGGIRVIRQRGAHQHLPFRVPAAAVAAPARCGFLGALPAVDLSTTPSTRITGRGSSRMGVPVSGCRRWHQYRSRHRNTRVNISCCRSSCMVRTLSARPGCPGQDGHGGARLWFICSSPATRDQVHPCMTQRRRYRRTLRTFTPP